MEKLKIEATFCKDGQEAYNTFVKKRAGYFSFILSDIQMPIMDGIECTKKIRNFEKLNQQSSVPIIMLTGNSNDLEKSQCLDPQGDIRATLFLKKPMVFADLKCFVGQLLAKKKQQNYLVVQQDPFHILMMSQFLQLKKIKYEVSKTLDDAYRRLSSGVEFDGIVVDCDLSPETMHQVIKNIRTSLGKSTNKNVTIIGIVSKRDCNFIQEAMNLGVNVLVKPIDFKLMSNYIV